MAEDLISLGGLIDRVVCKRGGSLSVQPAFLSDMCMQKTAIYSPPGVCGVGWRVGGGEKTGIRVSNTHSLL